MTTAYHPSHYYYKGVTGDRPVQVCYSGDANIYIHPGKDGYTFIVKRGDEETKVLVGNDGSVKLLP